ncbi:MAG: exodeoxyribonuclease VII large subunit [Deltaproteobacteria bacterium]|nr:exodeoxyribonuclease VII large subunit [Deltaproteobacteria bacterium]
MDRATVLTVSELNRRIKATLESGYADIWVEAEISNLRVPSSGHSYLTLKDSGSQLRAVMFRFARAKLRFIPQDGMQVVCHGTINVYEPRGEYQLVIDRMEPRGVGALQMAFEQLKSRLAAEGLFDAQHKQQLPYLPRRIGVVTSATGAALRDILQVLARRFPGLHIRILPVAVQGEGAAQEIAAAIAAANEHAVADVLIVGRGGGSLEDLWAFNEECVARAIFNSAIPVISAVGHEIDFTIADFVADMRAPTPSAAAELVVREKRELVRAVAQLASGLSRRLVQRITAEQSQLRSAAVRLVRSARMIVDAQLAHDGLQERLLQALPRLCAAGRTDAGTARARLLTLSPRPRIAACRSSIGFLHDALHRNSMVALERKRARLQTGLSRLSALNPAAVLERGFCIARRTDGGPAVRRAADLKPGDRLNITLHQGSVACLVENVCG